MNPCIDPAKLKDAAEHLEWVLKQYPDSEDVQGLLHSLAPLIESAKAGGVEEPVDSMQIPGAWNFSDGRYIPYDNPSVDEAYSNFITEMDGGLTEEDRQRIARLDAMRKAMTERASVMSEHGITSELVRSIRKERALPGTPNCNHHHAGNHAMTQRIDPIKLKATAEHLEWVLGQYPGADDVEDLLTALLPLIEASKSEKIVHPIETVPCKRNLAEGTYRRYRNPNVEEAYVKFLVELEGGLTDEDMEIIAETQILIDREHHDE